MSKSLKTPLHDAYTAPKVNCIVSLPKCSLMAASSTGESFGAQSIYDDGTNWDWDF